MADLLRVGATRQPPVQLAAIWRPRWRSAGALEGLLVSEARSGSARLAADLAVAEAPDAEAASVVRLFDLDGAVGLPRSRAMAGQPSRGAGAGLHRAGRGAGAGLGAGRRAPHRRPVGAVAGGGLARDFQQMRLDALRRLGTADPQARWRPGWPRRPRPWPVSAP
jgi:glutamate dehydrogenase